MIQYLGIDTSNYTTSAAVYDLDRDIVFSEKKLLSVPNGTLGLRQSDAVFAHIKQLPSVMDGLFFEKNFHIKAVCVSKSPRNTPDSYMPAFLVGNCAASVIASSFGILKYTCSHQEGHIIAALHSANAMYLLKNEFYAFHVSGGTTECLLVKPDGDLFSVKLVAKTLDLNAGQLVDRVGLMLGLSFPCGMAMDEMSLKCIDDIKTHPSFDGVDCHFSGAQNQCEALLKKGAAPSYIARYAIEYICMAIDGMTLRVMKQYGEKPVLYAGGVMSNSLIRAFLTRKYNGFFAQPEFSCDNASGVAIIASLKDKRLDNG